MSSYREDSHDIAVGTSSTWGQMTVSAIEVAKVASSLMAAILLSISNTAFGTSELLETSRFFLADSAVATDQVTGKLTARQDITTTAKVKDSVAGFTGYIFGDTAVASDMLTGKLGARTQDTSFLTSEITGIRHSSIRLNDKARVRDVALQYAKALLTDTATFGNTTSGIAHAKAFSSDSASAIDQALEAHRSKISLVDTARASAELTGHLHAVSRFTDVAVVDDEVLNNSRTSQSWVANIDNWAMSRFVHAPFEHIAVIDGVAYGVSSDGVYAIDSTGESIEATLQTGKIDLGNGGLVHPLGAYLEYQLAGNTKSASMQVSTTQTGQSQTYNYQLAPERADYLTNGRFIFGRGLRGRHFSFSLKFTGASGHINDLQIELAGTKRST